MPKKERPASYRDATTCPCNVRPVLVSAAWSPFGGTECTYECPNCKRRWKSKFSENKRAL